MRGISQAVVSRQTTVRAIDQRVNGRRCPTAGVLVIKSAHHCGRDSLRTNKTTYRSQRDAGRRVAVIGLARGAAAVDCQSLFINRGTVRGISQAVVAGQATIVAVGKGVDRCGCAGPCILIIKSADGAGSHCFRANKATQRAYRNGCVRVAVISLVGGAALAACHKCQRLFVNRGAVCGVGQAVVGRQTTVRPISQGVDCRRRPTARIFVVKSANGSDDQVFAAHQVIQRTHIDGRSGVAVIGLIRGATLAARDECQHPLINRCAVRGVGQAVVAGQAAVGAINQDVDRCGCACPGIL